MSLRYSTAVRDAQLDAKEDVIGTAPLLRIYTGSSPASCAAAATGTLLVEITLPSDWLTAASGGSKSKVGVWSGTAGNAGTAGYYRIYEATGTTCHEQGDVGAQMTLDDPDIADTQTVTVASYTTSAGNG